jgi:hypothetical protein
MHRHPHIPFLETKVHFLATARS